MKSLCVAMGCLLFAIAGVNFLGASPLKAAQFTFDFQHPNGLGSSFADAISLNRAGALTVDGNAIGFTKNNSSSDLDSILNLTASGLEFNYPDATTGSIILGVPFNNAAAGTTQVIARFSNVAGLASSDSFEQFGIGWGDASTNTGGLDRAFIYAVGSTQRSEVRSEGNSSGSSYSNFSTTGALTLEILLNKVSATQFNGNLDYTNNSLDFSSANVTTQNGDINNANSLGYAFFANVGSNANGFNGVLTSISFIGPNLEIPALPPVPEPASLTSLLFGLGLLTRVRRKARQTNREASV